MNKYLLLLASFVWLSADLHAQDMEYGKDFSTLVQRESQAHEALLSPRSNPATQNYDLKYHRLEWTIDPNWRYISGTVTSYFVPLEAGFQELNFDLSAALNVTGVTRKGRSLDYVQSDNDLLTIFLPEPLPKETLDSVSVSYEGVPLEDGLGSFVQSTHNGQPIIWTLSEPFGAKNWWPCKQDLNDKIDSIDVWVTTPTAYRVASNGVLVAQRTVGNQKQFHWQHRYPIAAYLIAIGVTNYAVYSDFVPVPGADPVEVLNYVYPEALSSVKTATSSIVPIMELYNEQFGLYPFAREKYGHAMFGFGGGMEHQTMSFMGGFSHLLQAHELAHQWFGDKVTCGSWSDIWLHEGFATYLEGLTYQFGLGSNTWLNWKINKVTDITSQPGGSVFVMDTTSVDRIFSSRLSYNKGAMVINMLRWKLGDTAFFQGVRNYLDDPKLAYSYARTIDLQRHLETAGGQSLTEFFKDWFYGEGFPTYELIWQTEGNRLRVQVSQTTSHPSVDFFEMPLPIHVAGTDRDTMLSLEHTLQDQIFTFDLPFEATNLVFDPNLELISANNTVTMGLVAATERPLSDFAIRIYPNPARDQVYVRSDDPNIRIQEVLLFDSHGRKIQQFADMTAAPLHINDLPAGSYLLRITTDKGVTASVFVKN